MKKCYGKNMKYEGRMFHTMDTLKKFIIQEGIKKYKVVLLFENET